MKRMTFLVTALLVIGLFTPIQAETVHNLLKQNDRVNAQYDLSVIPEILKSNANVFFVDSGATYASDASDGLHGESPSYPFATLDYAVGKCTASNNNIIVVMPYHNETVTAGSVDIDVSGITIKCLGYGPARPRFDWDISTGTFVVGRTGDGARIENMAFLPSVTGVTVGVQIEDGADNITFVDCEWLDGELSGTDEFVTAVDVVTEANDLSFIRCKWSSVGAGATVAIDIGDGAVAGLDLIDCEFYGDWATACVFSDNALTEVLFDNTVFINTNTDEYSFELQGTSNRGTVRNCTFVTSGNYVDMGGLQDGGGNKTAQYAQDSDTIDAFSDEHFTDDSGVLKFITKSSVSLGDGTVEDVFTVAGAPIIVKYLAIEVTAAVSANACNVGFTSDPTAGAGTDTPIAAMTTDIQSAAIGDWFYSELDGTTPIKAAIGTALPQCSIAGDGILVPVGGIDLELQNSDPTTGTCTVYLAYFSFPGGTVTAP